MVRGSLTEGFKVVGRISRSHKIVGKISQKKIVAGKISVNGVPYGGDYVVTPTGDTQVLHTAARRMSTNVVVNPIPSNYGLITWDGSVMTVS